MSSDNRFFAAICPHCDKKSGFDKNEVCSKKPYMLGEEKNNQYVTCPSCGKRFKVEVDCEGYQ